MSDLATIRAAIVAALGSVPNVGLVHSYERFAQHEKAFRDLYQSGGQLLGWNVRRRATRESSDALGRWTVTHEWRISGFMALNDAAATELEFDDLIEAARDVFRADETLGGVVATTVIGDGPDDPAGLQLLESGPVMFCGVLCHSARLALFTRHYL